MKKAITTTPPRTALIYLVFGVLWILLTDRLVEINLPEIGLIPTQTAKGLLFVGMSALLVYLVLRNDMNALREREHRISYQADLLDKVSDALISTDADFNILTWNAAAEQLYGWKAKEVIGRSLQACIPTQFYTPSWEEVLEHLHTSGSWMGDVTQECRDDRRISISTSISAIRDPHGALIGYIEVNRDLSSMSKTQVALRESQYILATAEEVAQVGSWKLDLRTQRITFSDQMFRIFEVNRADFNGDMNRIIAERVHPDDLAVAQEVSRIALEEGTPGDLSFRILLPDGSMRTLRTQGKVMRDNSGQPISLIGFVQDITESKQAEKTVRASETRYRNLIEKMQEVVMEMDEQGIFRYLSPNYEKFSGYSIQEELGTPAIIHVHPDDAPALVQGLTELAPSGLNTFTYRVQIKNKGWRWIETSARRSHTDEGSPRIVGVARDVSDRVQAEAALRESEEKYRLLAENITDVIWILDAQTSQFRYVSPSVEQMRGYTVEEVMRQSLNDALTPPSLEYLAQALPARLELLQQGIHETYTDEIEQPCKDGSTVWTETITRFIQNPETGSLEVYGVSRNITDRKQATTALRISEENYRSLAETSDSAIAVLDREGTILYANPTSIRVWGDPNIIGKTIFDIYPPEYAGRYLPFIKKVIDERVVDLNELETSINGQMMWFRISMSPIKNSDGTVNALLLNAWDITERKQAEEALRQSEARLSEAQRIGHIGHWEWTPPGNDLVCSDELFTILEMPKTGKLIRQDAITAMVMPEERQRLTELDRAIFARRGDVDYEFQVHLASGRAIWLHQLAKITYAEDGKSNRMMGIIQDITERKRAEDALKKSERVLRLFVEHSPAAIAMFDRDMRYIIHSRRYLVDYQLPEQDLTGRSHYDVFPEIPERWKEIHQRCLAGSIERADEDPFPRADGRLDYVHWEIHPWFDDDGKVGGIILFSEVITERVRAREELLGAAHQLEESHNMMELIIESAPIRVFWKDTQSRYLGCNSQFAIDAGSKTPADIIGKFDDELIWNDRAEVFRKQEVEIIATGIPRMNKVEPQVTPGGGSMWVNVSMVPLKGPGGEVIGTVGIYEDITERKQAEEALKESEERFSTAFFTNPVSQSIITKETNEIMAVNDACCHLFGYPREELIGANTAKLNLWENPADRLPAVEELKRTGRLLPQEVSIRIRSGEIRTVIVEIAPISWNGIPCLISTIFDITDRKLAEQKLKESEEKLREFIDNAQSIAWVKDLEGKFTNVNQYTTRVLGRTRDEIIGATVVDLFPSDESSAFSGNDRQVLDAGRAMQFEETSQFKDGMHTFVSNKFPLKNANGQVYALGAICTDITERKLAEENLAQHHRALKEAAFQLEESRNMLQLVINSAPIRVFWKDLESRYLGCNELFARDAGFEDSTQIIGKNDYDLVWSEYAEEYRRDDHQVTQSAQPMMNYVEKQSTADGAEIWLNTSKVPLQSPDGKVIGILGIYEDITDRKQAEEKLKYSQERLLEAQQLSHLGNWEWDLKTNALFWSDEVFHIFGVLPTEFTPSVEAFENAIHPEDRAGFLNHRAEMLREKRSAVIDHRIVRPEGEIHHVQERIQLIVDEKDEVARVIGTVQDITERKQAEESVKVQLKRITALNAIDNAISGSLDIKLTLAVLLREVVNQLKVDAVDILLLNPYMQTLDYSVGQGFYTALIQKTQVRLGEGVAGAAGLERRMVQIPNLARTDIPFVRTELVKKENFVSYFCLPLIAKGQLKGMLEIFHRSPLNPDPEWVDYLNTLAGQAAIGIDNAQLFEGLQRSNMEMTMAYDATIAGWSRAMDLRDKETEGHTQRVSEITLKLANRMGISSAEQIHMRRGALLHDIGKLGVPDHILLKPGKLTDEEWVVMRQHPTHAYEMLASIHYLHPALDIPYCHHEKWDGSGYPRGLQGEQIPLSARIFAIVDVWDALRSDRPYRAGWDMKKIYEYLQEQSGKHFDPQVVEAFLNLDLEEK